LEPTDADGIPKFSDLLTAWEKVPNATNIACETGIGVSNSTAQHSGRTRSLGGARNLARSFNPYDLLPAGATMYTYQGSLTTPPCSEVVFWNVVDTPVSISPREYLRLITLIIDWVNPGTCQKASVAADSGFTGRPVQNINGRPINRICPTDFVDPLAGVTSSVEGSATSPTAAPQKTSGAAASSAAAGFALAVLASIL
jgi:Eukaryotic-type carbonic anhydrase